MEKWCSGTHRISKFIIEEIIRWSMLRYETQKVSQQQEAKRHQCQMYEKDPHEQLQGRHENPLHMTYLGNQ